MTTRTPRRQREWQDNLIDTTIADGAQFQTALVGGTIPLLKGMTVVRFIIGLNVGSSVGVANSIDRQAVSMGIGIFTGDAVAAGSLPDPDTEDDAPGTGWLWSA